MIDPQHLDVAAMKELYNSELGGEVFYNALADRVDNERAAELLRRNGREESIHGGRVTEAIALLTASSM